MGDGLRVRVLGRFDLDGRDEQRLGSRKARTLVRRLAVADNGIVSVDELIDLLWDGRLPSRPRDQVGVLVARVRRVVGPDNLVRIGSGYALRVGWLDLRALDERVAEASAALASGLFPAAASAVDAALDLARGGLLPEEEGQWAVVERVRADSLIRSAHHIGARTALEAGDPERAIVRAEACLTDDPYDEVALRILMGAHAQSGRRASGLAAYARVRRRLVQDLGVSPDDETEVLHDRLLALDSGSRPPSGAIVGRSEEWARLDHHLAVAAHGGAETVAVVGVGGIGKSALVTRWAESLAPDEHLVCRGRCDPLGRDLPLQPIADALAAAERTGGGDEVSGLPDHDRILPDRVSSAGPGAVDWTVPTPQTSSGQQHLFGAILGSLSRLAAGRVAVLVVEDLHWAGPSTLAWMAFAARRGEHLLLLATRRPDGASLAGEALIELGPLDLAATVEWFGPARGPGLHGRTGGIPLLLAASSATDTAEVGLHETLEREVALLGPAAATVRAAAVLGPRIDLDLLTATLGTEPSVLLDHVEAAVAAGLLLDSEDGVELCHEMVREEIEHQVPASRRAYLHRRAADVLAGRAGTPPLDVALHARRGGDLDRAATALVEAADQARAHQDLDAAEELLTDALALREHPEALVARSRLRMARMDLDAAAADAARALALDGGPPALEVAGWIAYYRRRYDEAHALATEGQARAQTPDIRASCLALGGRVDHGRGDLRRALDQLEEADGGPLGARRVAAVWRAAALLHAGRPEEALVLTTRVLSTGEAMAHPFAHAHGHFAHAVALGQLGRVADALAACDAADDLVARTGVIGDRFRDRMLNVRGGLLRGSGRTHAAADLHHEVLARTDGGATPADPSVRPEAHWVAWLDLADDRLADGELDRAEEAMAQVAPLATWTGTMAWHQRHRADLIRSRIALARGEAEAAADLALAVRTDARARGAGRYAVLADAVGALAVPDRPPREVEGVVEALGAACGLEAWWLTLALAEQRGVEPWRRVALRRAEGLVLGTGGDEVVRRHVDRVVAGALRPV